MEKGSAQEAANLAKMRQTLGAAGVPEFTPTVTPIGNTPHTNGTSHEPIKPSIERDAANILRALTTNMPPFETEVEKIITGAYPDYKFKLLKKSKKSNLMAVEISNDEETARIPEKGYFEIRS